MNFYSDIAAHYDAIFPFNSNQLSFITSHISVEKGKKLIEIGSARGALTNACTQEGFSVRGLELDSTMVTFAKNQYPNIPFYCEDMLNLEKQFGAQDCDTMVCFGNTLVHLSDTENMLKFLKSAYKTLSKNGILMVQFINYDRIIDHSIKSLPAIQTEEISFERNYELVSESQLLFNAKLSVLTDNTSTQNTQALYPLRRQAFEAMAKEAGFACQAYGSFKNEAWTIDSMQSIFVCKKE